MTVIPSYYDMQCEHKTVPPVNDISTCVSMKRALPRCEKWLKTACYDTMDAIACSAAFNFCMGLVDAPYGRLGLSPYDITEPCSDTEKQDTTCIPESKNVSAYLSRRSTQDTLGVDPSVNYTMINYALNARFWAGLDPLFPTQHYIASLLERGVRVLVYVGMNDFACNWVGNEKMTLALEWTGKDTFRAQPLEEWKVDGHVAGLVRRSGPLMFATVNGAGHMVPRDKPKESLELLKRWLANDSS